MRSYRKLYCEHMKILKIFPRKHILVETFCLEIGQKEKILWLIFLNKLLNKEIVKAVLFSTHKCIQCIVKTVKFEKTNKQMMWQCDAGEQCAVRKGSRFGKLCSCPGGTTCSFSILKCLWKHVSFCHNPAVYCAHVICPAVVTCFIKQTHKINACIFV